MSGGTRARSASDSILEKVRSRKVGDIHEELCHYEFDYTGKTVKV
ncbi:MAG: hypothetical protein ACLFN4_04940 [Candidatus Acetothermia bacterium]